MPIYEYECIKCFSGTERVVKYEEKDSQICTLCGNQLVAMVSAPADITVEGRPKRWRDVR